MVSIDIAPIDHSEIGHINQLSVHELGHHFVPAIIERLLHLDLEVASLIEDLKWTWDLIGIYISHCE